MHCSVKLNTSTKPSSDARPAPFAGVSKDMHFVKAFRKGTLRRRGRQRLIATAVSKNDLDEVSPAKETDGGQRLESLRLF